MFPPLIRVSQLRGHEFVGVGAGVMLETRPFFGAAPLSTLGFPG